MKSGLLIYIKEFHNHQPARRILPGCNDCRSAAWWNPVAQS